VRLRLQNESGYVTADLRRILLRGLRACGVQRPVVEIRVVPAPKFTRGCAEIGGHRMVLAIGPPSYEDDRRFRVRLARVLRHEFGHLKGKAHDEMAEDLRYPHEKGTVPSWAFDGPLRWRGSARRKVTRFGYSTRIHRSSDRDPERRLYHVYAVELVEARTVYVGSSALPPAERMGSHRDARSGSRHVRRKGRRLRPDLSRGYGPHPTRAEARRAEERLARALERQGFQVYGACRPNRRPGCEL